MSRGRVTLPNGNIEARTDDDRTFVHAIVGRLPDDLGGWAVISWATSADQAARQLSVYQRGFDDCEIVDLHQCDACDVFDDTTRAINGGALGDTSQCQTCTDAASAGYIKVTSRVVTRIEAGGRTWIYTGKDGERIDDGLPCREYAHVTDGLDQRLWADYNGNIVDGGEV